MDLRHPNLLKVENIDKMDEEISVNDILDEDDMERWSDFSIGKKKSVTISFVFICPICRFSEISSILF